MRGLIIGSVLLVAGIVAVAVGLYPATDAISLLERVWPILLFVMAITLVAELAAEAGLFDVLAQWSSAVARGSGWLLWLLTVGVATVSTIFLSLDTTAVLLTPVVVAMARHVRLNPLPFALTTVLLANCASLLLPVSNLTNLLAEQKLGGTGAAGFVALSWAPAIVAILVPVAAIAIIGRRQLAARYDVPPRRVVADRWLTVSAAIVVVILLPALVSGVPVWLPACAAAIVLVVIFAVRRRTVLRPALIPWSTIVLAAGLFIAMGALGALGSRLLLSTIAGSGTSFVDLLRLAGVGAFGANVANNLPAYLALEPVAGHPLRIMALLIGVNAGSIVTPWASLATLLWHARLKRLGVDVPWTRYVLIGLIVAPVTVGLATLALAVIGQPPL